MAEFTERLGDGLQNNEFNNVDLDDLPIAVSHIAGAARHSPEELFEEALGFGIMSRNLGLVEDLLDKLTSGRSQIRGLYPLHLAASYLDGSKTCCNLLDLLQSNIPVRKFYVNHLGHTVLDQLMVAILKAHTSCKPNVADAIFTKEKRFEGEDVDICGRWDSDSDCIRTLLANGDARIPFEWKHAFCHTSMQTICHCIGTLFGPAHGPDINTPSGLFIRRCSKCGLKLQPLPLHTLLIVGLHLCLSGCKGETLFGILACLLSLLSNGANPLLKANISVQALLSNDESTECCHRKLDPLELLEKIPARLASYWSKEIRIAWQIIHSSLKYSQAVWTGKSPRRQPAPDYWPPDEIDSFINYSGGEMEDQELESRDPLLPTSCSCMDYDELNFFGESKVLATLWTAVQTELLTYRRLKEESSWLSKNFDMETFNEGLYNGGKVSITLVTQNMMRKFCECGKFLEARPACALVEDASAYYFSNLEDWSRTTFITTPEDRWDTWY